MSEIEHPFGCEPNCFGTLTIVGASDDDFSLNTWGWMVQNLTPLWFEAVYAGTNRIVPGADGRVGYPKELDESPGALIFYVTGYSDEAGVIATDQLVQLEANIELLKANVFDPVPTGDGARPCELTMPSGATKTARVQFDSLRAVSVIEDPMLAVFRMVFTIVTGRFE